MKVKHYAGMCTGIVLKDGLRQLVGVFSLGDDKPTLNVTLPVEVGWEGHLGKRITLSLSEVLDDPEVLDAPGRVDAQFPVTRERDNIVGHGAG